MIEKPQRFRLSRAKGFKLPPNTVNVARPGPFGNPFVVCPNLKPGQRTGMRYIAVPTVEDAVECFDAMLDAEGEAADALRAALPELRGKNVACWCKLDAPCHGDVLLRRANLCQKDQSNQERSEMHSSTFEYLKPTDEQVQQMAVVREAAKTYADVLAANIPDGPDKTYLIRKLRDVAMWANIAITRQPDGSPRTP